MKTTPGGIFKNVTVNDFQYSRTIAMVTFLVGLFSLATMIGLSGWTKSKKVGIYTTIITILMLLLIFITVS